MLRTLAAFSQRRFTIRTQHKSRRQAAPFVFRLGLAVSLLVLSVAATPTRTTAQTGQPPANAASLAQNENDVRVLELGKPIGREIKGGESHAYQITLTADQFLHTIVEPQGVDMVVTLFKPDGKKIAEIENPIGGLGMVSVIAEISGIYRLEMRPLKKRALAGRYEVKVEELRQVTPKDKSRIAAEKIYAQGAQLELRSTFESLKEAVAKYEESLPLWRVADDRTGEAITLNTVALIYANQG